MAGETRDDRKEKVEMETSGEVTADHCYSLANLVNQRTRIGHNPRRKLGRLILLYRRKSLRARSRSDQPVQVLPGLPELRTVPCEKQGMTPPNDLATHRKYGSVGVGS